MNTHRAHVKCSSNCARVDFASRTAIWEIIKEASFSFFTSDSIRSSSSLVLRLHSCSLEKSAFSRLMSSAGVIR